ncbi:MAG: AAA family ATPase [Atopobiaceae bacterium]|nr:AAA family ATPase [Atopobiaceae bacterium]
MGTYINPGNQGFRRARRGEYVDKTGLIALVNGVLCSPKMLICVSRPRRFGKSYAAEMLCAYYSRGCDSRDLFEDLAIAQDPSFEENLNAHNVIRLDMTDLLHRGNDVAETATRLIVGELHEEFPVIVKPSDYYADAILAAVRYTGRPFVFLIDEWDAPIRERGEEETRRYVDFLRSLFKNASFTSEAVAAAYMTGILPIKRYHTQSAISEFREYTMLSPERYAPYVGFTEDEVRKLCDRHGLDFAEAKRWYDGYELPNPDGGAQLHLYAPFSVMRAMESGRFASYWTSTAAYDSLLTYIERDFDGLQDKVADLVAGERLAINPRKFDNDMREVNDADDVFTVLAHLGYVAYDEESDTVRVPNEEVRMEFVATLERGSHPEVRRLVEAADNTLRATFEEDAEAVAAAVAAAHDSRVGPDWYNDEQSLRFAVKLAYLTAIEKYAEVEELPSGHGFADVIYLPKRYARIPALVVELKWNKPVDSALEQIRSRNYPKVLQDYGGPVLLVGITYDRVTKAHNAVIERISK